MEQRREEAEARLAAYGQEHLLRFYDELSGDSRRQLLDQVLQLDLERIRSIWEQASVKKEEDAFAAAGISPIPAYAWDELSDREKQRYTEAGWRLLREGKAGAIVVAGGQGSRLGYDGPKGTYDIGLPSCKSFFQLQAERLNNLTERAGQAIPWYIMTSPANHDETVRFFEQANYFGLRPADCFFFTQGVMPALDAEGKILLAAKDQISLAPSGNGDCFAALRRSGALVDMKRRGLTWLYYYNVDNALVKVADPLFLGMAASHSHPAAAKAAEKSGPEEQVGVLCMKSGRPAVVEYTVIPETMKHATDRQGKLLYGLGNLSMQAFRLDFIEKFAEAELPYAMAHKRISFIDPTGRLVVPEQPNAFKFERFIFDFFSLADNITVLKVKREEEFAPVKNKEGEDSPETARRLVFDLHRKWLLAAGVPAELIGDRPIEISPLDSYSGEGLTDDVVRKLLQQ